MYVMVCTIPDIAHVVRIVSRFISNPGKALGGSKVVAMLLERNIFSFPIFQKKRHGHRRVPRCWFRWMCGFRKEPCMFTIGGTSISWMLDVHVTKEWFSLNQISKIYGYCRSSQRAYMVKELSTRTWNATGRLCTTFWQPKFILLGKESVFHSRTKSIHMSYHFIRELINDENLNPKKILRM